MAVRPWENRFLDINLRDGVMIRENGSTEGKNGSKTQSKSAGKKPISLNLSNQKMGPSNSDGGSSSPTKSAMFQEASSMVSAKPKSKPILEDLAEEANSRPGVGSRSHSNPKERSTLQDKQAKKRLSLPNSGVTLSLYIYLSIYIYIYISILKGLLCTKKPMLPFSCSLPVIIVTFSHYKKYMCLAQPFGHLEIIK